MPIPTRRARSGARRRAPRRQLIRQPHQLPPHRRAAKHAHRAAAVAAAPLERLVPVPAAAAAAARGSEGGHFDAEGVDAVSRLLGQGDGRVVIVGGGGGCRWVEGRQADVHAPACGVGEGDGCERGEVI